MPSQPARLYQGERETERDRRTDRERITNLLCMDKCLGRNVTERETDRQTEAERAVY